MIINSNDIFNHIGLALDPPPKSLKKHPYTILLQIELSEDEKHILEVRDTDDPLTVASQFCHRHRLNKLAVSKVQARIREAKENEQRRYQSITKKQKQMRKQQKDSLNVSRNQSKLNIVTKLESPQRERTPNRNKSQTKIAESTIKDNIYLRSLVKLRLAEQKKQKIKVEIEKKEQEGLTFKPKINNVSEKIVQFLRDNEIERQKKPQPPKKMYEEMRQCTFKPKINKVSQRIVNNKSVIKQERQQFNKYYNNENKKVKKEFVQEQYEFKPKINSKSSDKITVPFFKRLQITQQKRANAHKKPYYDQEQCSFKPKVGRAPFEQRNKENRSVWEHLHYNSKKNQAQNVQEVSSSQISKQSLASRTYYENLVEERITQVFNILDGNEDGQISPNQISIQLLPTQCLHFLKPIFMQMDQVDATLNFYQFKKAVLSLMADSDPGSKGAFISSKWKKQVEQKQTFKPNINKRSKQLSVHRSVQNIYKEGLKEKQNKQYRMQMQRALKQQRQLAACSFKPKLNHSSKIYINKVSKKQQQMGLKKIMDSFGPESSENNVDV